jgi:hypothetical protein
MDTLAWRKSARSADQGNCVEIADWRKSARSGEQGNCVEIAVAERNGE